MITGRIVKTYSGFYYVQSGQELYTCKARGVFRKDKLKPLVGDQVELERLEDKDVNGNIISILPRHSELPRPSVANVDMALIVFSATFPKPKFSTIDKYLIEFQKNHIEVILCFNKIDTASEEAKKLLTDIYSGSGVKLIFTSAVSKEGLDSLKKLVEGKLAVFTGPSGVGKSSLINALCGHRMETGELSNKTQRGKQTTRHYELITLNENTMLLDSPGFTALNLTSTDYYELKDNYTEFVEKSLDCKYKNKCIHMNEPDCAVKKAVDIGEIHLIRYKAYLELLSELKGQRQGRT